MKIKSDFVTNSSSCAYIVMLSAEQLPEFKEYLKEMNKNPQYSNEGLRIWNIFKTKKELYEYATDRPYDWPSKAFHPKIVNMDKGTFNLALHAINKGFIAVETAVDYEACVEFSCSKYEDMMKEIPM